MFEPCRVQLFAQNFCYFKILPTLFQLLLFMAEEPVVRDLLLAVWCAEASAATRWCVSRKAENFSGQDADFLYAFR